MPETYIKFTTTAAGNAICQRCKFSFPQGTELHFVHDVTGKRAEMNVCAGCHQELIIKTQAANIPQSTSGKSSINEHLKGLY